MNRIAVCWTTTAIALATPLGGCSYQLVSPPARLINLESAKTAAPGETVAGLHGGSYGSIFDAGVSIANATVRRGVADDLEVDADASWGHVDYDGFPAIDRNVYAARLGAKLSNRGSWAAVYGGLGGGYAPAAGGFSAVDFGGALSFPNCYVVPFASTTIFGSVPLAAKQVDFRNADGTVQATDKADTTYGLGMGAGLEIPLTHDRCRAGLTSPRLQFGGGVNLLVRGDGPVTTTTTADGTTTTQTRGGRHGLMGLAIGVEIPF
jgi:hypothetical protein